MELNKEMSQKYGMKIYNSGDHQYPYYVEEWGECFTEDELERIWNEDQDFANIYTDCERGVEMPWDYGKHFD